MNKQKIKNIIGNIRLGLAEIEKEIEKDESKHSFKICDLVRVTNDHEAHAKVGMIGVIRRIRRLPSVPTYDLIGVQFGSEFLRKGHNLSDPGAEGEPLPPSETTGYWIPSTHLTKA